MHMSKEAIMETAEEINTLYLASGHRVDLTKLPCGVIQMSAEDTIGEMPAIAPILESFPHDMADYVFDVKVHMLMPGQFPCIPNWHFDNVPRRKGRQQFGMVDTRKKMYLWLSGPPYTQFEDERDVPPQTWLEFDQLTSHRGVESDIFCWRLFIRATHVGILTSPPKGIVRRHSQVYLDAGKFRW